MRLPSQSLNLFVALMLSGTASVEAAPPPWTEDLLGLTGTATVFDTPVVRDALQSPAPPGNLEQLTLAAGYRPWAGARLWLLSQEGQKLLPARADTVLKQEMDRRGLVIDKPPDGQAAVLSALLAKPGADRRALAAFFSSQGIDGVVVLSAAASSPLRWQLIMPEMTLTGALESGGRQYLPHVWAENLALQWQWPGLKQAALVQIRGINGFSGFKLAETALGTVCRQVRLLRIQGDAVSFACQTGAQGAVPEQTGNLPLVPLPLADHGLDDMILMGRQLSARSAVYQWQATGANP
jgi:hypothetical protein